MRCKNGQVQTDYRLNRSGSQTVPSAYIPTHDLCLGGLPDFQPLLLDKVSAFSEVGKPQIRVSKSSASANPRKEKKMKLVSALFRLITDLCIFALYCIIFAYIFITLCYFISKDEVPWRSLLDLIAGL